MGKLEKDVMKDIRIALDALERAGAVLWYSRLNSGKVRTEYGSYIQLCVIGTPDFIVTLKTSMGLLVLFLEAKSDTGKQSIQQREFQRKHQVWSVYRTVRNVDEVRIIIEELTGFYKNKLRGIEL